MLSSETLRRAAELTDEIEARQNELNQLLAGQIQVDQTSTVVRTTKGHKRVLSPEALEKIRAAQRRRWKRVRKEKADAKAAIAATQAPAPAPAPAPAIVAQPVATPAPAAAPVRSNAQPATPAPATDKKVLVGAA